jgi:thiol-disulfide isomerase/thioredoxin
MGASYQQLRGSAHRPSGTWRPGPPLAALLVLALALPVLALALPLAPASAAAPPTRTAPGADAAELPPGWRPLNAKLPAFDLADLDGKRWRLEELRGRRLYIIGWATWCGYCRQQLPLVEELRRRVAGRTDVAVLTFNVDDDESAVAPYMSERGFTFPALLADEWYARHTNGSVPKGWIVDAEGVARYEQSGFARQLAGSWVADTLGLLESVAVERTAAAGK